MGDDAGADTMMIATPGPDATLARHILVALAPRHGQTVPLDELAIEVEAHPWDLAPTLDAMEHFGQVARTPGTDLITLGSEAARRFGRASVRRPS